jgi:peptide/nickel transport system substrate-binding protein
MRKSRALGVATIGVAVALVAAACSGSSKPTTGSSSKGGGTSGSSSSSSAGGGLPLNTNPGSGSPQKGGVLHMLGQGDVDYFDPNISYYTIGQLALRPWNRQLLNFAAIPGHTTDPAADLATDVPTQANGGISADGLTYKLTIRKGAKWDTSPPRQVTAADAVRGLKRTCNPAQPFGGMPDFENLIAGLAQYCAGFAKVNPKSASAIAAYENSHNIAGASVDPSNPLTVVYKLTHPASYFTAMLTMNAFSPAPVEYDKYIPASSDLAQHTVADGPYKVASYNPTKSIKYVRNTAWDPSTDPIRKAYVNEIDVSETGNQDSIQQQLKANTAGADMEFDAFPPNNTVPQLYAAKDPNFNLQPSFSSNPYVIFNTVSPNNNKALANVKVRQALSEALNRNTLIQDASGPLVSPPLTHVLPAGISGTSSNTSPSYYPYNPTKAKADLQAAGASHLTLKFLYRPSSTVSKAMFLSIQQDLGKVGVSVTGVTATPQDFYTKYLQVPSVAHRGVWDISLAGWGPDWYGDAALSFFAPLFYGNDGKGGSAFPPNGSDFGFYNSATVNQLVDQASKSASASAASQLWQQADKQVMDDAAIFPITADNQPTYHASHTHNTVYIPQIQQIDPTNVWLSNS